MAKKMLIDATHAEETRVVVVDGTKVEEFDFETVNKRQISGNIYLAKVTRVEPSLQAAFVDYGGNRHGFLAFAEIHPDYYQIPAADRQALIAEERAYAEAQEAEESNRSKRRKPAKAQANEDQDEVVAQDAPAEGEEVVADSGAEDAPETDASESDSSDSEHQSESADEIIESVAEEDVTEEIRPSRKPRPRRYKIQEVIKVRQIMLVQVVKEERGNKGAALTTYLSLPGRYCVLMPNTARGGGISRKITNVADRKKLKDIAAELDVPQGAGLIIRTAGSQRTKTEIRRDYEYLLRLWEQIRELTFKSVAPAPIYEEGDLIKRTIRDLYSKDIDEVLVEGERGYRAAKDFMKMIMPSHAKNVKLYSDPMPLFARYQVESYLAGMFNPVVQLKSGGYIVIGVTEALVAIDVNSGRSTKEGSIEETALKTNLEAADEVARQLRLRDLAGLIVIDFIDMEERRNNAAVEKRMKERLKSDRARIQIGRISGFGLMEMSRQRLRPGMLESTTQPCAHCHGTGLIRSDDSLALTILRAIEEEGTRKRSLEVLVKAPVAVINFLINNKREHIASIEARYGLSVRLEADPAMISPDFAIEKFKIATRVVPEAPQTVLSVDADLMASIDDEDIHELPEEDAEETGAETAEVAKNGDEENGEQRGRRRRRRRRRNGDRDEVTSTDEAASSDATADEDTSSVQDTPSEVAANAEDGESGRRRSRSRSRSRRRKSDDSALPEVVDLSTRPDVSDEVLTPTEARDDVAAIQEGPEADIAAAELTEVVKAPEAAAAPEPVAVTSETEATPQETVALAEKAAAPEHVTAPEAAAHQPDEAVHETAPDDVRDRADAPMAAPEPSTGGAAANVTDAPVVQVEDIQPPRPKRRGWWSVGK